MLYLEVKGLIRVNSKLPLLPPRMLRWGLISFVTFLGVPALSHGPAEAKGGGTSVTDGGTTSRLKTNVTSNPGPTITSNTTTTPVITSSSILPSNVALNTIIFDYIENLEEIGDVTIIPQLRAVISDTGVNNQVRINLTATTPTKVDNFQVGFNIEPFVNVEISPLDSLQSQVLQNGVDISPSPQGSGFDLRFTPTIGEGTQVKEFIVTAITGTPPDTLTANSFNFATLASGYFSVAQFTYKEKDNCTT